MENRALGKGLSALIPEKTEVKSGDVKYLNTALIDDNKFQPRTNYDDAKLSDLKASIKEKGVLQPVLVREKVPGRFEVIAGERRLRAARDLKMESIPVIVKNVTDQEALVIALIENIQREELNPVEEAEGYRKLIEDFQYTHDDVAQSVGKDRSTISNLLRLLKLPDAIRKSLYEGALSVGHARALLSVESTVSQKQLFETTLKKGLSVRQLENLVKVGMKTGSPRKDSKAPHPHVAVLEESLQKFLGTKVRIFPSKKRGKIVIEYYSLEDLDRIIKQFIKK